MQVDGTLVHASSGRGRPRSCRAARPSPRRRSRSGRGRRSARRPPRPGSRPARAERRCAGRASAARPALTRISSVGLPARTEELGVGGREGPLVGRAEEVGEMDLLALVVEDRRLHGTLEEVVGVAAEELVEGILAGDVDGEAAAATPARPHIWRSEETVPGNVTTTAASSCPMSIPSSSASVVTTARSSPRSRRPSSSRRCWAVYPARYGATRSASSGALARSASTVSRLSSSTALRDFTKQITRAPARTSWTSSPDASPIVEARLPSSGSVRGGFQIATRLPGRGRSPRRRGRCPRGR